MRTRIAALALVLAPLVACSHRDKSDVKVSFDQQKAAEAAAEPLGPGDVRVTSTDGVLVLALLGDSVRMQLGDSLRDKVQHDLDAKGAHDGFGGLVARSVAGVVGNAMGVVVRVPVADLEDVRYEDGMIKFETRGNHSHFSVGGKHDGSDDSHARFTEADGQRFVAAVKARQAQLAR
jgi:hypothetical protein